MSGLWPGDELTDDSGKTWTVGPLLAYQGCERAGPFCSQIDGRCVGWHCSRCDAPTSSQGHNCPVDAAQ